MKHVLVIDNSLDHTLYRPLEHWRAAVPPSVPVSSVYASAEDLPADLSEYSHVIVSGSEASVCKREPWAEREAQWLLGLMKRGVPLLGSCWGHQLMAYAWAGEDYIGGAPMPEVGWLPVEVEDPDDPLVGPEAPRFFGFNIHFDEVPKLPPDFIKTARSKDCAIHAMRHRSLPLFGLQSHPEVPPKDGIYFLNIEREQHPEYRDRFDRALAEEPVDSGEVRRIVARFLEQ